jgi:hypothetical protein
VAEAYPCGPAQRHAERNEALGQPQGAARPGDCHHGEAFGEDAAAAVAIAAEPLAHAELEAHTIVRPGQVGEGALVVAVDTPGGGSAERTGHTGLRRSHPQGDQRRGSIDIPSVEGQRRGIR